MNEYVFYLEQLLDLSNGLTCAAIFIYYYLAVFGACIGSFINVVAVRLPIKGKLFSDSRSRCPACGHHIRWYDLFPVFSWFVLLGRCRDCKARIPFRYPAVEAICALLAMVVVYWFGLSLLTIALYAVTVILLAISLIDLDTAEIPDSLLIALLPFAVASIWLYPDVTLLSHLIGMVAVALPLLLLTLVIPGAFGGGDIKLMAVCGLFLGWQQAVVAFFVAVLLGGVYAIYLLLSGKRKRGEHMVFGPALCFGTAVSFFYGKEIIGYYLGMFFY